VLAKRGDQSGKANRQVFRKVCSQVIVKMDLTKNSAVERFCRDALAAHARLFRLWHKFRGGQIDRRQLLLRSLPVQK
jgi:hypothetical protein